MSLTMAAPIGIIAGAGRFPLILVRSARSKGLKVAVVAHARVTLASVAHGAHTCRWQRVGQLEAAAGFLLDCGARQAILAGNIPRNPLTTRPRFDRAATRLVGELGTGGDHLLRSVAAVLESFGISLIDPSPFLDGALAAAGLLAGPPLSPAAEELAQRALAAARELGRHDRGQAAIALPDRLLLEGRAGTDGLIRNASRYHPSTGVLAKAMKPGQDRRFDLPTVGPRTITAAARAGLSSIVMQAGCVVIDGMETARLAEALGLTLLAVSDEWPDS